MKPDVIGYIATATFAASYFFEQPRLLRAAQALGCLLWLIYGICIHAMPVIVSNVLVGALALWSTFGRRQENAR